MKCHIDRNLETSPEV